MNHNLQLEEFANVIESKEHLDNFTNLSSYVCSNLTLLVKD